jgi:flagellar hook-basal body complex protein FliE
MAVSGVGGIGGVNLSQLAQLYRQQVLSGSPSAGAQAAGTQAVGTQAVGTQAVGTQAVGTQAVGTQAVGTQAVGTQAVGATAGSAASPGADFAAAIGDGLRQVEQLDRSAAGKATQAATGDLKDVQDYVITAMQAQTATELTTTVRNKALDAFNEIMRMPL